MLSVPKNCDDELYLQVMLLEENEIDKPEIVFRQLFEYASLRDLKRTLHQTLETLTDRSYVHEPTSKEHNDVIYFFRKLEKLIEAAYLLR